MTCTIYILAPHSHIEDKMPISSEDAKGMTCEEALEYFENTKFINIRAASIEDVTGIDPAETTVNRITVNNKDYNINDSYPYDSEIIIDYSIKRYYITVKLECSQNLIFNKYNIKVSLNDEDMGLLKHGEELSFISRLKKGKYTLTLISEEDNSIVGARI